MKIAFISQPFDYVKPPIQSGSINIWINKIIKAFPSNGDDQFIIYSPQFPGLTEVERYEGVEYRRIPVSLDSLLAKPVQLVENVLGFPRAKRPFFASTFYYSQFIKRIALDLQKQDADIVHIHNFSQFVPVIRKFNPAVKIVLHMHCEWLSQLDEKWMAERIAQTDRVIGCSPYITDQVRKRFPVYADRCKTVHNGVDITAFHNDAPNTSAESSKRLLFVGRVSPEKGVHTLLDAMASVLESCPDVQLDIVGTPGSAPYEYIVLVSDVPEVNNLQAFYHEWRHQSDYLADLLARMSPEVAGHVNFVGTVPHDEIATYYHNADILVNPSYSEAFGMSLVEAMASQTPVVATRVGGMTNVVEDGKTGLLVEMNNPAALAEAIVRLMQDDDLRRSMGRAGREEVVKYSWERIAADVVEEYRLIFNERAAK
jgi:spore coat protein SA